MKKNLFLGMTLGMVLLANTAFAHLSGGYLSDIIDEHPRWPLATQCIATDVNLRTEPNTNCEVVTMLQNGDKFYARKVVFIPNIPNSKYVWVYGTTEKGYRGYMYNQFIGALPDGQYAHSDEGRFQAAVEANWINDPAGYAAGSGYSMGRVEHADDMNIAYDLNKVQVGPRVFYTRAFDGKTFQVVINKAPGEMAGYTVGQHFDQKERNNFYDMMRRIGWHEAAVDIEEPANSIIWEKSVLDADGFDRPAKQLIITLNDKDVIESFTYINYDLD